MRKFLISICFPFIGLNVATAQSIDNFLPKSVGISSFQDQEKTASFYQTQETTSTTKDSLKEKIEKTENYPSFQQEKEVLKKRETKESEDLSLIELSFQKRATSINSDNSIEYKIKQFGYEFFKGVPSVDFSAPVDKFYVLGPGDELFLYVIGAPPGINIDKITRLVVDRQGKVYIPGLGVFFVWGMSLGEAEKIISNSIGANIKLTVGNLRTFPVYVSGEVNRPGRVLVTGVNTVIDAIMMAGGIKKSGTLRNVLITRKTSKGLKKIHIDFYKLLLEGKPVDVKLRDGDVIFVGSIGKVAGIAGKVKKPAIYELKGNETIEDLINLAGGLLPSSYRYKVVIQRYKDNKFLKVLEGSLDDKKFISQKVQDGDLVSIKTVVDIPENAVMVDGYTPYQGIYAYKEGMKLSEVLKKDMFYPDSNMKFGLIERKYPLGSFPKYLTFSPEEVLNGKEDLVLKPRDRIILFKFGDTKAVDLNKVRDVFIVEGEIKYPGIYAYKEGMKLSEVLKKDMLTLNTNLYYAEIDRRDPTTLDIVKIEKFSPIDIIEGKKDFEIHKLDLIKFYPKYVYPPIKISGLVKKPFYLPYREGLKLSEALSSVEFLEDVKKLKVVIFRKRSESISSTTFSTTLNPETMDFDNDALNTFKMEEKEELKETSIKGVEQRQEEKSSESKKKQEKEEEVVAIVPLYRLLLKADSDIDLTLKPGDRLIVQEVEPEEIVEKVVVSGYVKNPGIYKIGENTTLYDVLKAAGGFRKDAYPQGVIILRESVRKMQQQRIAKIVSLLKQQLEKEQAAIMQADLSSEEIKARQAAFEAKRKLLEEMQQSQVSGRIAGISIPYDLEKLKNSPYNILLEDGDQIFIPKKPGSVLVFGEVYNPSALVYRKGLKVRDYIQLAGGFTKDADKENIFVIKADGSVVSSSNVGSKVFAWDDKSNRIILRSSDAILDYELKPGDSIVVPLEVHVPVMWRPLIKDIMQIIYQGAITVYTITKI
ncbi:MAG: SLBB domain-containing protein [Desulfurobacteriaceae bacterium]